MLFPAPSNLGSADPQTIIQLIYHRPMGLAMGCVSRRDMLQPKLTPGVWTRPPASGATWVPGQEGAVCAAAHGSCRCLLLAFGDLYV